MILLGFNAGCLIRWMFLFPFRWTKCSLLGKQRRKKREKERETPKTTFVFYCSFSWLYWKYIKLNEPFHLAKSIATIRALLFPTRFHFRLTSLVTISIGNTMSTSIFCVCEEMANVVVGCNFNWGKFRTFYLLRLYFSICVCVCLLMSISRLTKTIFMKIYMLFIRYFFFLVCVRVVCV